MQTKLRSKLRTETQVLNVLVRMFPTLTLSVGRNVNLARYSSKPWHHVHWTATAHAPHLDASPWGQKPFPKGGQTCVVTGNVKTAKLAIETLTERLAECGVYPIAPKSRKRAVASYIAPPMLPAL